MKRLRLFFAIPVMLLFFPLWRYLDMLAIVWPHSLSFALCIGFLTFLLLALPLKLIRPKTHWALFAGAPLLLTLIAWRIDPLSKMASHNPEFSHCGPLTYTGSLYPIRVVFSAAHQDDLEIRNQLCWVRKMVVRILPKFDSEIEYQTYHKLITDKLMKPERKYKVTLPLIGLLYGNIINRWDRYNIPLMKNIHTGKLFIEEMSYWTKHYTEEVSVRDYGWWDYIHGNYIKWEYGLVEKNWQSLLDGVVTD